MGVKNLLDLSEVSVGENHTSVEDKLSSDQIEVLAYGNFISNIFFLEFQNGSSHKSVLAHNHLSIDFSKGLAHDANLLGGDVVDVHENTLGEFVAA